MKNILKISTILTLFLGFIQCTKFEPENTNVMEFAGDWYFQVYSTNGTLLVDYNYEDDVRLYTYNSSSNSPDELWIDDKEEIFPLKAKFKINGTSKLFLSSYGVNEYLIEEPDEEDAQDGEIIDVEIQDYILAEILEAKILPGAATLWPDPQKAKTDSIFIKIKFSSGTLHWIARKTVNKDGDTILYYERASDFFTPGEPLDTFIIQGHRQTGWEVHF